MSDSNQHDDSELGSYLDGRDGVSAAYRSTAADLPPPALDRLILQAAHAAPMQAEAPKPRRYDLRTIYSLAASLMVAVLVASLFYDQRPPPPSAAPASPPVELRPVEQSTSPPAGFTQRQLEQVQITSAKKVTVDSAPAPLTRAAESPPTAVSAAALAPAAASTRPAPVVFSGPELEKIEAADLKQLQKESPLEEVMVTGSRVSRADDLSYRNAQNTWIAVIGAYADELKQLDAQGELRSAHGKEVADKLRDERDLFARRYPQIDIDTAVKALPRQAQ